MMNNTYSLIISQSERAWSFQWAKTLFALERRLNDDERLFYLKKYAINMSNSIKDEPSASAEPEAGLGANSSGEQFVPGLMIIKLTNCTRAETRRKLVGYWQVSFVLLSLILSRIEARRLKLYRAQP